MFAKAVEEWKKLTAEEKKAYTERYASQQLKDAEAATGQVRPFP